MCHFSHLLFQIFQIFSLDLKFSNLLFQIFFSFRSLYHHFSTTHQRWRQRKFLNANGGFIEKNYMHFSTTHHRWLQRKFFGAITFTSPKTTNKIHNRRAISTDELEPHLSSTGARYQGHASLKDGFKTWLKVGTVSIFLLLV